MELELRAAWECLQRCEAGYAARLDAAEAAVREASCSSQVTRSGRSSLNARTSLEWHGHSWRQVQRSVTGVAVRVARTARACCRQTHTLHRLQKIPTCTASHPASTQILSEPYARQQAELARITAAHEDERRRREEELRAAATEADNRAIASREAVDAVQGELSHVLNECRALKALLEQARHRSSAVS